MKRVPRSSGRRPGVSEVMGAVIMIAVTVVAGAAVWGYVNSATGTAGQGYAEHIGSYVDYLHEKIMVFALNFTSNHVTVWLYNYGETAATVSQVSIWNSTKSFYQSYSSGALPATHQPGTVAKVSFATQAGVSFHSGVIYPVRALGAYGTTFDYRQAM